MNEMSPQVVLDTLKGRIVPQDALSADRKEEEERRKAEEQVRAKAAQRDDYGNDRGGKELSQDAPDPKPDVTRGQPAGPGGVKEPGADEQTEGGQPGQETQAGLDEEGGTRKRKGDADAGTGGKEGGKDGDKEGKKGKPGDGSRKETSPGKTTPEGKGKTPGKGPDGGVAKDGKGATDEGGTGKDSAARPTPGAPGPSAVLESLIDRDMGAWISAHPNPERDKRIEALGGITSKVAADGAAFSELIPQPPEPHWYDAILPGKEIAGFFKSGMKSPFQGSPGAIAKVLHALTVGGNAVDTISSILGKIGLLATVSGLITTLLVPPVGAFLLSVGRLCNAITLALSAVKLVVSVVKVALTAVQIGLEKDPVKRLQFVQQMKSDVLGAVGAGVDLILSKIGKKVGGAKDAATKTTSKNVFGAMKGGFKEGKGVFGKLGGALRSGGAQVRQNVTEGFAAMKKSVRDGVAQIRADGVRGTLRRAYQGMKTSVTEGFKDTMVKPFSEVRAAWKDTGAAFRGIRPGIQEMKKMGWAEYVAWKNFPTTRKLSMDYATNSRWPWEQTRWGKTKAYTKAVFRDMTDPLAGGFGAAYQRHYYGADAMATEKKDIERYTYDSSSRTMRVSWKEKQEVLKEGNKVLGPDLGEAAKALLQGKPAAAVSKGLGGDVGGAVGKLTGVEDEKKWKAKDAAKKEHDRVAQQQLLKLVEGARQRSLGQKPTLSRRVEVTFLEMARLLETPAANQVKEGAGPVRQGGTPGKDAAEGPKLPPLPPHAPATPENIANLKAQQGQLEPVRAAIEKDIARAEEQKRAAEAAVKAATEHRMRAGEAKKEATREQQETAKEKTEIARSQAESKKAQAETKKGGQVGEDIKGKAEAKKAEAAGVEVKPKEEAKPNPQKKQPWWKRAWNAVKNAAAAAWNTVVKPLIEAVKRKIAQITDWFAEVITVAVLRIVGKFMGAEADQRIQDTLLAMKAQKADQALQAQAQTAQEAGKVEEKASGAAQKAQAEVARNEENIAKGRALLNEIRAHKEALRAEERAASTDLAEFKAKYAENFKPRPPAAQGTAQGAGKTGPEGGPASGQEKAKDEVPVDPRVVAGLHKAADLVIEESHENEARVNEEADTTRDKLIGESRKFDDPAKSQMVQEEAPKVARAVKEDHSAEARASRQEMAAAKKEADDLTKVTGKVAAEKARKIQGRIAKGAADVENQKEQALTRLHETYKSMVGMMGH